MKKIALFSAAEKTSAMFEFARNLVERGYVIWASGGTYKAFVAQGIEANDIKDIVGKPILNHRVVSLSREIFAGILGDVKSAEDLAELEKLIGGVIEIVYVDLYHLQLAIEEMELRDPVDQDWESIREKVDIGGPSLLRAAAKGDRWVICDQREFPLVVAVLDVECGPEREEVLDLKKKSYRLDLACKAEMATIIHAKAAAWYYDEIRKRTDDKRRRLTQVT